MGKLDRKVRQASRLVEMLRRTGDVSRPLPRISPSISRLREPKRFAFTAHAKWIGRYDRRGVKLQHGSVLSTRAMRARGGLMVLVVPVDVKEPAALRCLECDRIDPLQLPSIAARLVGELRPPK